MGPLNGLNVALTVLFALAALLASGGAVLVTRFLPRRRGPQAGRGAVGAVLVYGTVLALVGLVGVALAAATALPWAVAAVAAGLAFLAAPFLVEPLPDRVLESRLGLVILTVAAVGFIVLLPTPNL